LIAHAVPNTNTFNTMVSKTFNATLRHSAEALRARASNPTFKRSSKWSNTNKISNTVVQHVKRNHPELLTSGFLTRMKKTLGDVHEELYARKCITKTDRLSLPNLETLLGDD
jgi:hypothetical protein